MPIYARNGQFNGMPIVGDRFRVYVDWNEAIPGLLLNQEGLPYLAEMSDLDGGGFVSVEGLISETDIIEIEQCTSSDLSHMMSLHKTGEAVLRTGVPSSFDQKRFEIMNKWVEWRRLCTEFHVFPTTDVTIEATGRYLESGEGKGFSVVLTNAFPVSVEIEGFNAEEPAVLKMVITLKYSHLVVSGAGGRGLPI